jgi:hypothetical protein
MPYFGMGHNPSSVLSLYAGFFARLATIPDIVWGLSSSFRCGPDRSPCSQTPRGVVRRAGNEWAAIDGLLPVMTVESTS